MCKVLQKYLSVMILGAGGLFASGSSEDSTVVGNQNLDEKSFLSKNEVLGNVFFGKKHDSSSDEECVKQKSEPLLPSLPCPDNWRFSGSFLYLLPTVDDTYFVLRSDKSSIIPNGKRENNDFSFSPAFRVGAEYAFCNTHRELNAFYSHLTSNQKKTINDGFLWATNGRPDLVSALENYVGVGESTLNLLYHCLEVSFSQQTPNNYGMYFYVQPGIEYAYLRLGEKFFYQSSTQTGVIDQKSRTWGVGPQIGFGLDYNFYQGVLNCRNTQSFSITSLFSGSILMGRSKTYNDQTLTGVNQLNVDDEATWRTTPALHARVGLNYLIEGPSVGFSVGVGYEFNTYIRGLSRSVFPDDTADSLCTTNYYNFDVQGLSVTGALSF